MARIALHLNSVRAVRRIRAGAPRARVSSDFGLSAGSIERIESSLRDIPDAVLAAIERVLDDKEKLRSLISTLIRHND